METVGDRIRAMRNERSLSRPQLSQATGIGYSSIAELERGGQKSTTKLHVYAKSLGVTALWLETGKGQKYAADAANDDDFTPIIGYAQGVALGDGMAPDEYAETHKLKFRADSLRRKGLSADALAVYYGNGDSMEPTIEHGDAIMFDTADTTPRDDSIFIIESGDGTIAKRLRLFGDRWFVVSDNPHDPKWRNPVPLDDKRRAFHIVGRVRWIARWKD